MIRTTLGKLLRLRPYARRARPWLAAIAGLTLLGAGLAVAQPWPLKLLVDGALAPEPTALLPLLQRLGFDTGPDTGPGAVLLLAATAAFTVYLLTAVVDMLLTWCWVTAGQSMVVDLAADLLRAYHQLSLRFHARHPVGDALARIGGDAYCVYSAADCLLISPAQQLVTLALVSVVAWQLDPALTVATWIAAPAIAIANRAFAPLLKRRATAQREAQSRLQSFVHQTLTALPVVQTFATGPRNTTHFSDLAASVVDHSQRGTLERGALRVANSLVVASVAASVLWVGGQRVLAGALSVGGLLVYLGYLATLQAAWHNLLGLWPQLKTLEASLDRVCEILDETDRIVDPETPRRLPSPRVALAIRWVDVGFAYEHSTDHHRAVLDGVELAVEPGETLAIVGPTGAGKSTLVALVPRLFDVTAGRVEVDGVDVRALRTGELRQRISLLFQEPFLLPMTIADNIAYGRPDLGHVTRADIQRAAREAAADEFIEQLPGGYDCWVGERGVTLSGGQRQRLALARALLRQPSVLILDEPTAALDPATESTLLDRIGSRSPRPTTIIVAHRLASVRGADRIAVLDQGKLIECGSHQTLLAAGGLYAQMWQLQSLGPVARSAS